MRYQKTIVSCLGLFLLPYAFSTADSLFCFQETEGLKQQIYSDFDKVALIDGTLVEGRLDQIPSIHLPFGERISLGTRLITHHINTNKLHLLIDQDERYVGTPSVEYITIIERNNPQNKRQISLSEIDFILLKPSYNSLVEGKKNNFQFIMINGDSFPGDIVDHIIQYSSDHEVKELAVSNLEELKIEAHPSVKTWNGEGKLLDIAFGSIVDRYVNISIPNQNEVLRLPWNQIARINRLNENPKRRSEPFVIKKEKDVEESQPTFITLFKSKFNEFFTRLRKNKPILKNETYLDIPDQIAFEKTMSQEEYLTVGEDFIISEEDVNPVLSDDQEAIIFISGELMENESSDIAFNDEPKTRSLQRSHPIDAQDGINSIATQIYSQKPVEKEKSEWVYISQSERGGKGFYLKEHKVTNQEYKTFVDALHYKPPSHWPNGKIPLGMENKPVVNVSYKDALLYTIWAGKRLPSQEEMKRVVELGLTLGDMERENFEWTSTSVKPSASLAPNKSSIATYYVIIGPKEFKGHNYTEGNERLGFRVASDSQ